MKNQPYILEIRSRVSTSCRKQLTMGVVLDLKNIYPPIGNGDFLIKKLRKEET